ncbi:hypothetical protein [Flavobacterium sp. J27]|uniref:hypothetical protein n=1 Tax=Flavobacterium sp. J27 TaxID=2060419 RepID=UPI00102F449F|nr:hypothetical protein [Flavobacterium sp. J27]
MTNRKTPFLDTIYHLRTREHGIIYDKKLDISSEEAREVIEFLQDEYEKERLNYPFIAPSFDEKAALWASKTVYFAIQLVLNRKDTESKIDSLFPIYNNQLTASAMLSTDLCLRFLPTILLQLQQMDAEDPLLPVLEHYLTLFSYSAIGYDLDIEQADTSLIESDACLLQLYLDRLVEKKDRNRANHERLKPLLLANMGNYKTFFWNEL